MTREQATYNLKALLTMCDFRDAYGDSVCAEPYYEAVDMAIEALADLQPTCNQLATDCVSRQAAIDEIKEIYEWHDNVTKERIIEHFVRLPSEQPEIIRCKDCKHFHYDMPYVIQGIPVLGHEVCDFWGDGCKTSENGFCSFAEE